MPKPALHQSSLRMLCRCPKQYEFRYVNGVIRPPGVAALVGTGVHVAVAEDLGNKIMKGALLPADEVADAARDGLNAAWDWGVLLSDDEKDRGEGAVKGAATDKAIALSGLHHTNLAPWLKPTAVERTWRITRDGWSHDLVGTIDVQEADSIRDTKTAAKSPPKGGVHTSLQLTMYAIAIRSLDGAFPRRVAIDTLVALKTPKLVVEETTRGPECWPPFARRIKAAIAMLKAGVFPPCDPSEWCCSPRWCGWYKDCPYV